MFKPRWMRNSALADPDYFTPIKWTGMYDHTQVFQHYWKILECNGLENRELLIQCGGHGNLRRTLTVLRETIELNEFRKYFAKSDDTSNPLKRIGFIDPVKLRR
jgi:hypothetical protein